MEAPFFSIVIPTYNRAHILERAVQSCLNQTYKGFEIIVVDDCSTDNTQKVLKKFRNKQIHYFVQPQNAGPSAARNRGIKEAKGSYIAFLDSDDTFMPGKLQAIYDAIQQEPDADKHIWYSQILLYRGENNQQVKPERAIGEHEAVADYFFADDGVISTCTLVIAKKVLEQISFDESLKNLEDPDLCIRLQQADYHFKMLPETLAVWYDDNNSDRISYQGLEYKERWFEEHSEMLSKKARYGFLLRHIMPAKFWKQPVTSFRWLFAGLLAGSVTPKRALLLYLRSAVPSAYTALRNKMAR